MLSGFSEPPYFHKLVIAPLGIRDYLMDRVDEEIAAAKAGRKALIQMKMNSLSDTAMIEKLYEASHAGVEIHLLIRGICNLKVGIPVFRIILPFIPLSASYWNTAASITFMQTGRKMCICPRQI